MNSTTGKNIVVCLDGTGNQFKENNSNVVKLFRVLQRNPATQVGYYDPGVGTLADPDYKTPIAKSLNKAFGLAFGRGLTRNVEEAYSYLMEHYEDGDDLFIFGFSRGAYTARVLAGFIHQCGLLEKGCQNLIPYAMKLYKKADFQVSGRFKATLARPCRVKFLGLWDSVSTFGWVYDPLHLPWTTNNASVGAVRHALAIDERRVFFRPKLWGPKTEDTRQVWFAGVHSDVGGGYPESKSGLAKVALEWMIKEALKFELLIDDVKYEKYVLGMRGDKPYKHYVGPSATADQHESLKGPWWPVELLPQREQTFESGGERRRWHGPHLGGRRTIPEGAKFHRSVEARLTSGGRFQDQPIKYAPTNLPQEREFVN